MPCNGACVWGCVVLANVDFGGLKRRKMIRNYVADGGRLVLLGGNHALKRSSFVDTFVSDCCRLV